MKYEGFTNLTELSDAPGPQLKEMDKPSFIDKDHYKKQMKKAKFRFAQI